MTTGTVQISWKYRVRHYSSQIPLHTHTHTHTHTHSGRIEAHWRRLLTDQSCLFASIAKQVAAKLTSSKITAQDVWSTLPLKEPSVEFGEGMIPDSSTLAWKIPWTEEPGRLQSMGSLRVGHDWVTSLSLFTFMHWKRKWQPTPVFLPGESQGQRSLVGCHLWGRTESDMTEAT